MNPYEVTIEIDGKVIVRTQWAANAMDALSMALMNAQADAMGAVKNMRLVHIGPPQADILRAQALLSKQIADTTAAAISSGPGGPRS
jgi:hypothetical protein